MLDYKGWTEMDTSHKIPSFEGLSENKQESKYLPVNFEGNKIVLQCKKFMFHFLA